MRALIQRVASASVSVDGAEVSRIGSGMLVLLGVAAGDGPAQADRLVAKLPALRIFEDAEGLTNDVLGDREILCVSQFTLLADVSRGNRPGFSAAAPADLAEELYVRVCDGLDARRGVFGARMAVELVNDGPFTLLVEAVATPEQA